LRTIRKFKYGEPTTIRQLIASSYFFHEEALYVKNGATKDKATLFLCHPVAGGEYREVVQTGVNVWLPSDTEINVAQITLDL